jgi:L-seryl-tRNA(Ser) seleniumtransferase
MDLGSGLLLSLEPYGLRGEPTVREAVADGSTLVVVSGDKLLGGPQAGILVGARQAVDACRRNPLTRAMRVDKLTLAALEATLALYRDPARAVVDVPVLAMVTASPDSIRERAGRLSTFLRDRGISCDVVESEAAVGGGAFPTARLASTAVALRGRSADLEVKLRSAAQPIIGRIVDERMLLDLRSLLPDRDEDLASTIAQALSE